ncbi:hypothetical protein CVT26_014156 [Gymnopilus dilepis]|uniref:Protein YOP1 n=1 Tax=Gymnopilus dilepis TaxID=231916 RepID=A0A409VUG7_9AGAR|nr:hypothetical protein CVT26_014156 [Gymnopilus dilepis]
MPLFVPVLRLLMLFLNVYDSYKTLKEPPPSARNAGRPSVRAMSQRKRDMKGCLAVWIVWASLSIYERTVEAVVCLFIPFYEEFKSLALLFLILTRARGAEPIYLHVIRPLVKPYTRTLDATLELMLHIGDFIFALSTYPIRLGLDWYRRKFGSSQSAFDFDSDTQSSTSNAVNTSEVPTSFLASSGAAHTPGVTGNEDKELVQFPRKATHNKPSTRSYNRRPSDDTSTARHGRDNSELEPVLRGDIPRERQSRTSSQKAGAHCGNDAPTNSNIDSHKPAAQRQGSGSSSRHQIWYPPQSSYVDEEVDVGPSGTLRLENADDAVLLALEQEQYEEWRQYPPFPSAYPPTPLATTSRLTVKSTLVSIQPQIEEEKVPEEDFHKSLLPPREPLNPSHAGDLSDRRKLLGIPLSPEPDDNDDSMSADDYEDEDDFDITLRTPLLPMGSLRSQIPPRRLVSLKSASSAMSLPSRSSALTTADNDSAMPVDSSSLSDSSSSLSAPNANVPSPSASVIGKKRAHPRSKTLNPRNRVRQIESETSQDISESDQDMPQLHNTLKAGKASKSSPVVPEHSIDAAGNSIATSSASAGAAEDREQIPPEEKRRKIIRSSQTPPKAARIVNPSRPIRQRVARHASPPAHPQKVKLRSLAGTSRARNPTRLLSGTNTRKAKDTGLDPSSHHASLSALQPLPVPARASERDLIKKT